MKPSLPRRPSWDGRTGAQTVLQRLGHSQLLDASGRGRADAGRGRIADGACAEIELVTHWPDLDHLVDVVRGSPFAPVLAGFDAARQDEALRRLRERYRSFAKGNLVEVPTYATVARAVAES